MLLTAGKVFSTQKDVPTAMPTRFRRTSSPWQPFSKGAERRAGSPPLNSAPGLDSGFSVLELSATVLILGTIAAAALPQTLSLLRDYRLHSDAAAIASFLNLVRMEAASQYAPYRMDVSIASGSYALERLCGGTSATSDPNCTGPYSAFTVPAYDTMGTQRAAPGDSFSSCRPSAVNVFPGSITADPAGCSSAGPDPLEIYFNTRGSPVTSAGAPLSNGGAALYITSPNGMVDAVTVSVGGRVSVYNWNTSAHSWSMR